MLRAKDFEVTLSGEHEGDPIEVIIKGCEGDQSVRWSQIIVKATGENLDAELQDTYEDILIEICQEVLADCIE